MSKIPVEPIFRSIMRNRPKIQRFLKANWKEVTAAGTATITTLKELYDSKQEIRDKNEEIRNENNKERIHHRKKLYKLYKVERLEELNNRKRTELLEYKLEIEQFIQQIKNEEIKEMNIKKVVHSKRINNWNEILIQVEDKMTTKDYQEYIQIYNNPNYQSSYFEGYEGHLVKYNELIKSQNIDELYNFIFTKTKKSLVEIERDFL